MGIILNFKGGIAMGNEWLKDCEICNAGLCTEMDKLINKHRLSEHTAAKQLALTVKERLGFPLYKGSQLRDRYRYHKGKKKPKVYSSTEYSQEELNGLVPSENVGEIPPKKPTRKKKRLPESDFWSSTLLELRTLSDRINDWFGLDNKGEVSKEVFFEMQELVGSFEVYLKGLEEDYGKTWKEQSAA